MPDMKSKIAERLERAFAERGFTEPGVAELRERAEVSIRTLYKHFPSRAGMILAALEHRHRRYLAFLFPEGDAPTLDAVWSRVGRWMAENAFTGCLFHAAVAAHPQDAALKALLQRHKSAAAARLPECAGTPEAGVPLLLVHEVLVQSWPIEGEKAVASARRLAAPLIPPA